MEMKFNLPLLPLRDIVVFPNMVIPLFVGRDKSINALNEVMKKEKKIKIKWPNNTETYASEGDDWFSTASKAGLEIPTGCLTGSCGACEIDVNGDTIRACISDIRSRKKCLLKVSLTTDPFWEN